MSTNNIRGCHNCGKELNGHQRKYCSRECQSIGSKTTTNKSRFTNCVCCGKQMSVRHDGNKQRKYCSRECYYKSRAKSYEDKTKESRWCSYCKQHLPLDDFSSPHVRVCKSCAVKKATRRGIDAKAYVVELLGGKCKVCGYDKCQGAFDLHHPDASLKVIPWNTIKHRSKKYLKEWVEKEKVELLCSNCHRETHWDSNRSMVARLRRLPPISQ